MATSNDCDREDETKNKSGSETEEDYGVKMSPSKSQRGREEEEEEWNPDMIKEESKKLKKICFHWNWRDECTILKNLYEFAGKKGSYSKEFYKFVKEKLSVEVSNSQLSDKVYRLRKRFLKDKSEREDGKLMKKRNDENYERVFEMSRKIWGDEEEDDDDHEWKDEAVNEWYGKMFKKQFENIKMDITCIPPNVLQDIRKDWEDTITARNQYHLKNANLRLEISNIRCTQNM